MEKAKKIMWGYDVKQITQLLVDNNNIIIDKISDIEKRLERLEKSEIKM